MKNVIEMKKSNVLYFIRILLWLCKCIEIIDSPLLYYFFLFLCRIEILSFNCNSMFIHLRDMIKYCFDCFLRWTISKIPNHESSYNEILCCLFSILMENLLSNISLIGGSIPSCRYSTNCQRHN